MAFRAALDFRGGEFSPFETVVGVPAERDLRVLFGGKTKQLSQRERPRL